MLQRVQRWAKENFPSKGSLGWKGSKRSQNWSHFGAPRTPFTPRTPFKGNCVANGFNLGTMELWTHGFCPGFVYFDSMSKRRSRGEKRFWIPTTQNFEMGSNRLKSSKKKSWFHGFLFPNRLHQETLQQESLKWAQTGSNLPKKSWFHGFLFPNRLHQETLQQESLKWAQTDSNLQKKNGWFHGCFFLNRLHQETFAFGGPAYLTPPFTAGAFPMFMGGSEPPFTFTGTLGTPSFPTALAPGLAFALAYSSVGSV